MPETALIEILALISGLLIGGISIGGVLLVPMLSLAGVPVHGAVAASMAAFIFSGVLATWFYARRGSIDGPSAAWLSLGAAPAAFLGAMVGNRLSGAALTAIIGAAVIFAGLRALWRGRGEAEARRGALAPLPLAMIGAVVGFGSALTGTGGAVLLVPVLLGLRLPILAVVGLSQAIQAPIALLATVGNLVSGTVDGVLFLLVASGIVIGCWGGARVAHALPAPVLTRIVGSVLLAVGALLIFRALAR